MENNQRSVVLGLGNLLQRDEGFGLAALRALQIATGEQPGLEFIDGGVMGLDLLPLVETCQNLLILDAVNTARPPGEIVELTREKLPLFSGIRLSQHQVGFQEVLGLAAVRERLPERLHLIGIQPADLEPGMELSATASTQVAEVVRRAIRVLTGWGLIR
ncbi:MAG TPA: HyaD/HybD family hydrogenase maturation endopeptidase [Anaerolineaceae bacterium]